MINPDKVELKEELLHEGDYIDSIWKHHSEFNQFIIEKVCGDSKDSNLKLKSEKDTLMQKER
jgi:hypothetical protein